MREGAALRIDLFGEDLAHELFTRALVSRVAGSLDLRIDLRAVSSRGGVGRALRELRAYGRRFAIGATAGTPDLLVAVVDANDRGTAARRRDVEACIDAATIPRSVVGCPDPYIERWYCADDGAFQRVVGAAIDAPRRVVRDAWKSALADAVARGDVRSLNGGIDLAPDLVAEMDLHHAGRSDPSLGAFIDDLTAALRSLTVT